ncbi:type VI secretion system contractile sheath small subunit [Aestuariibacter salexigens]|uniref:type VI secretion system contractile sheath small subunit n=1 Tax=Aestuariibacter salexigens TaxID=226010 RepID=UPI0004212D13|nr:type VI secretion system contractile sheath small subunit [Aestuariibacter salexigens]
MAKSTSIAPKERVNITYKAHTDSGSEEVELPNKLLVVGDFTMREEEDDIQEREAISVDKSNFNDVMAKQNLKLDFTVENKLSEEDGEELPVSLEFKNMRDFEPENVIRQVPELNTLLELRNALTFLKGPLGNIPAFKKQLETLLSDDDARAKLMSELGMDKD